MINRDDDSFTIAQLYNTWGNGHHKSWNGWFLSTVALTSFTDSTW